VIGAISAQSRAPTQRAFEFAHHAEELAVIAPFIRVRINERMLERIDGASNPATDLNPAALRCIHREDLPRTALSALED
jgi:hypothetical protein